jgi:hypothetical protein
MFMQVRTRKNMMLSDDEYVTDMMDSLMEEYPEVRGYVWDRMDNEFINIIMWGEISQ